MVATGMKLPLYLWAGVHLQQILPHPKWWFSKGNPIISGKSRLVKYYSIIWPIIYFFKQTTVGLSLYLKDLLECCSSSMTVAHLPSLWWTESSKLKTRAQKMEDTICILVVVSNIFYFHPYLGKWSNLTNIFQMGWNHQLGMHCLKLMLKQTKGTSTSKEFLDARIGLVVARQTPWSEAASFLAWKSKLQWSMASTADRQNSGNQCNIAMNISRFFICFQ